MRRSPLKRKTPLKDGKPLERRSELARGVVTSLKRTRLSPISARGRAQKAADATQAAREGAEFHAAIKSLLCVVCRRSNAAAIKETGHGHQAHHGVPKSVLKKLGLRHLLWDPENAVCVCEEPCHRRHTDRVRGGRIKRAQLPKHVESFAARHGLVRELEREYPA